MSSSNSVARLATILLFLPSILFCQPLIQKLNDVGSVDWERYVVLTSGSSASLSADSDARQRIAAIEHAKSAAVENLFKAIQALTVNSNGTIQDALKKRAITVAMLRARAKRFTIIDTRSMSDLSIEIDVELPMTGNLLPLFYPKTGRVGELRVSSQPLCPTCFQPWPEGREVPEHVHVIVPTDGFKTNKGTPYTGLVIDVRGLDFNPAINPNVLNAENQEIYSAAYIDWEVATRIGMVGYNNDINAALKNRRIGAEPLIIRAAAVRGRLKSDIIISNNDAILIHAAATVQNFLRDCKVVILFG